MLTGKPRWALAHVIESSCILTSTTVLAGIACDTRPLIDLAILASETWLAFALVIDTICSWFTNCAILAWVGLDAGPLVLIAVFAKESRLTLALVINVIC